jgi:hypothetical protein
MMSFFLVVAFAVVGAIQSFVGDDVTTCNDENAHEPANIAACANLISSGKFIGAALKSLYVSRTKHFGAQHEAERAFADYNQTLLIDPKNIDLLDRTFIASLAVGDIGEAVKLADRILTLDKSSRIARRVVGVCDLTSSNTYAMTQWT